MSENAFERGLAVRRELLGSDDANRAMRGEDPFTAPMRQLVAEYCWGEVWARPGLPRKTRSLITLSMLAALNRPDELKIHIHGALNIGTTKEELTEVFLQVAIYCGIPAAWAGFRLAKEVFEERNI